MLYDILVKWFRISEKKDTFKRVTNAIAGKRALLRRSAKTYICYAIFLVLLVSVKNVNAQCGCAATDYASINVSGWTAGQSGTITTCQYGGERSTIFNTVAGAVYRVSSCGTTYDTQLSIYTTGCGYIAYNDDNGPACTGTAASVQFTSPGGNLYAVFHKYNCTSQSTCATVTIQLISLPCAAPAIPGFGNGLWNVIGYNGGNIDLTGTYSGYYTESNLSFSTLNRWGSGGSPSDASGWQGCVIPVDNHVVVSKRTGFTCRKYQIDVPAHDDDARLYINGSLVWSHEPGCCDVHTNVWTGYLNSGSTVEFRHLEGGGGSYHALTFTDVTPAIVNGNMTVNGTAGNISLCESNSTVTIAQNGGSFPDATYYYWIGYNNGSGWVNSWDLMNGSNANVSSFSYTLPGPGNYVIHSNATNNTCGWDFYGAGVTRLVTVNAIAPGYSIDYSLSASAQSVTIPASSGTSPSLGTTSGASFAFTSNVPSGGGAMPVCVNWGLPKTIKVIDANHTGPCIIPLSDADAQLTFNPTDANTNLAQGDLCFTGTTNFVGAANCAVRLRIRVRLTSDLTNGFVPFQMMNSGNFIIARVNNNVTVRAWLEVQAPAAGLSYYSGTAGGVAIAGGSSWHAVLPFFDNILNKSPLNNICSSFYYDWKGAGENGAPFGAGFFKVTGINPAASANPNPYCSTAPAQTALALTGGTGTASGGCTIGSEWRTSSTNPISYSGTQVATAQNPSGLTMAANTYNYILSGPANVCYGTAAVTVTQNIGNPTTWTGTTSSDWFTHSNWDHCVPDITKDAIIPVRPNIATIPSGTTGNAKSIALQGNSEAWRIQGTGTINIAD